jgi:hypothetical protein
MVKIKGLAISLLQLLLAQGLATGKSVEVKILRPSPFQVFQREGYVASRAHEHEPGGPVLGYGMVPIAMEVPELLGVGFQYRVLKLEHAFGREIDWTDLNWIRPQGEFGVPVKIYAGGWYRIEIRCLLKGQVVATAGVEPVGVGEVFVIAGQSYAAGCNDELTRIDDPAGRVVAFDVTKRSWSVAHDPQPNVGSGGTIWPSMANVLLPIVRVPIGLVNVAVNGSSSRQWLPGEALFNTLADAGRVIGRFRAVLWQQGESDVVNKVSVETYIQNLILIRTTLAKEWRFEPPWLLAKSTLHPTIYNDPIHEGMIREAVDRLWKIPGFRPGPDTDILGGENRGGPQSQRHFSGIGQRRAGEMWFAAIWSELNWRDNNEHPDIH